MKWHTAATQAALDTLDSSLKDGLNNTQAQERLAQYGCNELRGEEQDPWYKVLFEQCKNSLIIILLAGACLSLYIGHAVDAIAIGVIVIINVLISFAQEMNMQKSMNSLSAMSAPSCLALRDGNWVKIAASTLVPGDVVKLNTGAIVPADMRLLEAAQLRIDEAALTGESVPSEKHTAAIEQDEVPLGDQNNMAFMGTVVATGNAVAIVVATGMETQMGHIANMLYNAEEAKTPMQQRVAALSRVLIGAAFTIVAGIVGIGLYQGMGWLDIINTGISLTVAAIPEGLVTVVTIVLTLGAKRMVHNKALTRKLASVETLGSSTVICSDKTGTLTQNKMQVLSIYTAGKYFNVSGQGYNPTGHFTDESANKVDAALHPELSIMLKVSAACNDALLVHNPDKKDNEYSIQGMPTEGALVVAAAKAGITKQQLLDDGAQIISSFPFDSSRKLMSAVVQGLNGKHYVVAKGAPDVILRRSNRIFTHGEAQERSDARDNTISDAIEKFSSQALRTLAIAIKELTPEQLDLSQEEYEKDLTFIGIHGIMDPPKDEVAHAIEECHSAGIRTVMITGDHAGTADAIADKIGLKPLGNEKVVTGAELDAMSESALKHVVKSTAVYARVTPEHKLRIVNALQANGEVAAMTGDGVNDAPALRSANIGVAMGIAGTDVAKEAADLILLDDNFTTIVKAVREGRRIYDNMRKFIRQALTANVSEVSALLFAFLLMGDEPLLTLAPLMILWVNLVSDGIPALALGVDNEEAGIMKRKPVASNEGFFTHHLAPRIVIRGLVLGFTTYFMFQLALDRGATLGYAQTTAFMTLIFGQMFHVFDARTFTSVFRRNPFSNKALLLAVAGSSLLSLGLIYSPLGSLAFGTEPLALNHLIAVICIASLPTFVMSGLKEVFSVKWF